jgi:transposase
MKNKLHDSILELKEKGLSHKKISEILNCSKSTVSIVCKKYRMKNNILLKDVPDDIINKTVKMRKSGISYNEIKDKIDITEDQLIYICRAFNLNNSNFYRKPSDKEIYEMQQYYNICQSTRKVSNKFGWSKSTISNYLVINSPNRSKLSKEEYLIKRKKDQSRSVVSWRQRTKIKLAEYKGGCCQACNYNKSIGALEFHHIDSNEKDFSISAKSYSFDRLKKEVDKCILVCSNCHIEIHDEIKKNGYSEIINKISK